MRGEQLLIGGARILPPAVGVVEQTGAHASPAERQMQGGEDQLGLKRRAHRPANDATRGEVEDDGQVAPALARPERGDIGGPDLIRAS